MASGDATAIPIKNQAYRVTFPIYDTSGELVTAAGSLDSEISKDGGAFTDVSPGEATEIAASSGMYYLDLTATEMNADTVAIIVKSTGGTTTPIVLYPAEATDIPVDAVAVSGSTAAADDLEASILTVVQGTAQTGTLSTTQMTSDLSEATNDHYNGRIIIWTSGLLLNQATNITDYVGSGGLLTFTQVTDIPSNGDTFIIV